MGIIKDKKRFKPTKEQTHPTNPTVRIYKDTSEFDLDSKTIKDQQNKN
ncbi:hypothetical protein [Winogradskyella sp.]